MYILYKLVVGYYGSDAYTYAIQKEHLNIKSNKRFEIYAHDTIVDLVKYIQKNINDNEPLHLRDISSTALSSNYEFEPIKEYNSLEEFIEYHMNLNPEYFI